MTARVCTLLLIAVSLGCSSSEICAEDELECFQRHLVVEVDGKRMELEDVDDSQLGSPQPSSVEVPQSEPAVAWAVGDKVILELRSDADIRELDAGTVLESAWAVSDTDVWAIGGTRRMHYNGVQWMDVSPSPHRLHAVWASGPNDVWFAGDQGAVMRFDGTGTQLLSTGTSATFLSISGNGPNDVWIGGDGALVRFNGATFSAQSTGLAIKGIYVDTLGNAAMATGYGLYVWAKGEASMRRVITPYTYNAIHGVGSAARLVSGAGSWTSFNMPGTAASSTALGPWDLRGVWTNGPLTWLVGANGLVAWAPPGAGPREIRTTGPDLYAVTGAKMTAEQSPGGGAGGGDSAAVAPAIKGVSGTCAIDTRTSDFTKLELDIEDKGAACRPMICFYLCGGPGGTSRCVMGGRRCIGGVADGLQRQILPLGVKYEGVDPAFENAHHVIQAVPVIADGPNGRCTTLKGATKVKRGQEASIDCEVKGPPLEDSGGGSGGSGGVSGGACGHCIEGQTCAACPNGSTSCGGKNCCTSSETCRSGGICVPSTCSSGASSCGRLGISTAQCGATAQYTVQCGRGACCPACMICGSNNDCLLP